MFVQALSAIVHTTMIDWAGIFGYDPGTPLIFTQFFFWGFFAVVLVGYSLVYRNRAVRYAYLFAVSLFFYWKTSGLFIGTYVYVQQGAVGNIPMAAAFTVVPIVLIGLYLMLAKRLGAFDAL